MLRSFLSDETATFITRHVPQLLHHHHSSSSNVFYKEDIYDDDSDDNDNDNDSNNDNISRSIDIDISTSSPFMMLPSIVQMEVVTEIYQYITSTSATNTISTTTGTISSSNRKPKYTNLKKILPLIAETLRNGQRSKVPLL